MATPVYVVEPDSSIGLTYIEALTLGGLSVYYFWHQLHPVFCILIGIGVVAFYLSLLKNTFFFYLLVLPLSMALWCYIGFRIAVYFFPQDDIWQITGAVIGALFSFFEKKATRSDLLE